MLTQRNVARENAQREKGKRLHFCRFYRVYYILSFFFLLSARRAATPLGKRLVLGVGVVGTSLATVGMRMYLMVDAGYTGAGDADADKHARVVKGPAHEQSLFQVMKDALKGFA